MFQPETSKRQKKPCRGLEISMPKSQTRGSSTNHTASSLLTTWGAVLGNPGTILVKAMPEGKRDLGSELLWSPPQKDCFKMSWVKNWGAVVHKGFYFRTRCLQASVNLTCMPTCGKSSTNIYIHTCKPCIYQLCCCHSSPAAYFCVGGFLPTAACGRQEC